MIQAPGKNPPWWEPARERMADAKDRANDASDMLERRWSLLLESSRPDLVSGMNYLMGTFRQGWNRARQRRDHVRPDAFCWASPPQSGNQGKRSGPNPLSRSGIQEVNSNPVYPRGTPRLAPIE
jgi:hypothetical protein